MNDLPVDATYRHVEMPTRNVRMSIELMDALVDMVAQIKEAKVTLDWGEPDPDGFYTPTLRIENVAAHA